ncbi:MAG: YqgE/AlgH family protein [Cyclobacteriaceae bacterium]
MDYFSTDKIIEPSKGDLLISEPYLPDPNFERTVILMCEHDENGSIGFVLNRTANVKLTDVMEDVGDFDTELFVGGPVQQDTLHFIHRSNDLTDQANKLVDHVYWGGNYDEVLAQINTKSLSRTDIRFFMGYSGWSPGQLMDEMKVKSWIVLNNVTSEMIFDWDNQDLWKACLKSMGGKFKLISNYPKDPRLN